MVSLSFVQCGSGEQKVSLSPEARQIVSQMTSPKGDGSLDFLMSLREQTVAKIAAANLLEGSDPIVVLEHFSPGMKRYKSIIYTSKVQMSFSEEQIRVKGIKKSYLTDSYRLVENNDVSNEARELIEIAVNNKMDEYIESRKRIPRISNWTWLISIIKNDGGNITVSTFRT
jgi:hypothetical protein